MHDNVLAPELADVTIHTHSTLFFKAVAHTLGDRYAYITQLVENLHWRGSEAASCVLAGFDGMIPLVGHAKIHSAYQMMASK